MILDAFDKLIIFYFFTFVHFQTQNSIKDFVPYLQRLKKYFFTGIRWPAKSFQSFSQKLNQYHHLGNLTRNIEFPYT